MPPIAAIVFVLTVLSGAHLWVGSRTVGTLELPPAALAAGWAVIAASALSIPAGLLSRFVLRGKRAEIVAWIGMVAMGVFSLVFTGTLARDLGWWLAGALGLPELFVVNVDGQPFPVVWAIIGSALFALIVGLLSRRRVSAY